MKIFPINNTLHINKNYNCKPIFKGRWIEDANSYEALDSYVDETGLHNIRHNVEIPSHNQIIEDRIEKNSPKNVKKIREKAFLTQNKYETTKMWLGGYKRTIIRDALYNLRIEDVAKELERLEYNAHNEIIGQPFFMLGLADIPLTEKNKESYQTLLDKIRRAKSTVNVIDEYGITLLEKVMNAENEPYLETIKIMCNSAFSNNDRIAYDPMQKYAFDGIQNPDFKEKCKNLPVIFHDIIDDIKRKDLKALDKDIQEQMKCGFCNLQYAWRESIYMPAYNIGTEYSRIILDIAKKHFPFEVDKFINKIERRF